MDAKVEEKTEIEKNFKLLSWNIDGLDKLGWTLEVRTRGIVDIIQRENPDAIFLQEVIPRSLVLLKNLLIDYESYIGNVAGYFVAIFTRRSTFQVQSYEVIPYYNSTMGRNLLIVHTIYKDFVEIDLMTTHHESSKRSAYERIQQLKLCFEKMILAPQNRIVLFGGDLNMRENELQQAGGIPTGIYDLWIVTGKNEECAYTWDMERNTNLGFSSAGFRPRCRYDRLYFRPATALTMNFNPVSFKLVGLEIIPSIQRFCSDHFGIQVQFQL